MSLLEDLMKNPLKEEYRGMEEISEMRREESTLGRLMRNPLKTEAEAEERNSPSILEVLFREPQELGKTLAMTPKMIEAQEEADESKSELLKKVLERNRRGELDPDVFRRIGKILGEDVAPLPEGIVKSTEQIIGDIAGTLLWVTPIHEVKILKGLSTVSRLARGATLGGAFATAAGMSEDADIEELAKRFALGAAIGGPLEAATPFVFKGLGKALLLAAKPPKMAIGALTKKFPGVRTFILPVETRLKMLGEHGAELAERFLASDERTLGKAGARMEKLKKSGLYDLEGGEKWALHDALQGMVKPEALSPKVGKTFMAVDKMRRELAEESIARNIKIRVLGRKGWDWKSIAEKINRGELTKMEFKEDFVLTKGKKARVKEVPFVPKKNYYPQEVYSVEKLRKGKIREEILDNTVRMRKFSTRSEAEATLDSYIQFVDSNGRGGEYWLKYVIKTGQADTMDEARGMTARFFRPSRNRRYGHLEASRELNIPFYDSDPSRAIPMYVMGATQRLEQVAEFGARGEVINSLLGKLERQMIKLEGYGKGKGLAREARDLVNVVTNTINRSDSAVKASIFLRSLQTPKLAFAQIVNAGQSLNTLLATDLPSLAKGLQLAFTQEGQRNALRAGATLESVLKEMRGMIGSETRFSDWFLKLTGFSWTEKFNRTVAVNTGMQYARRLERKLAQNPADETIQRLMKELRLNPSKVLKDGFIQEDELLRAGLRISNLTQFRARPIDLPAFASSPTGKVIFQFKNFAYNQSRFLYNQLSKELRAKSFGRASRTLLIFSMVFPMTGEVTGDVRSLLTGSKRPTNFLHRYLDNIALAGGLGIASDMIQSLQYDKLLEAVIGPTVSTFARSMEVLSDFATTGKISKSNGKFLLQQPGITRPLVNYLLPYDSPERETILEMLD